MGATADAPRLSSRGVSKAFAGVPVLRDVTLDIEDRTSTALLGLNGAGKSTLLRLALDLSAPDSGTICLQGIPARLPRSRSEVAFLPERFEPPHYLTGEELLTVLLQQHGVVYNRDLAATECAALGLEPAALQRRARGYSKGMSQKLGLIACLLSKRRLLLLDEPMSGLDPLAHRQCCARLAQARAAGTTLLFSSHVLHDVQELCERVVVLHGGRLVFDDALEVFLAHAPAGDPELAFLHVIERSSH